MSNDLKSANSVKTGKKFSKLRKELGYSVSGIAENLFVNIDYIDAIEKGNYSIFPSEAFAKAYFQKYKDFLNIECEFPNVYDEHKEQKFKKIRKEIKLPYALDHNTKKLIMSSLIIVCALLFFYFVTIFVNPKLETEQAEYDLDIKNFELIEATIKKNKLKVSNNLEKNLLNQQLLELSFSGECWIEIYINEEIIEAQQFSNGDIYNKQILSSFKIVVGNADLVKGTYNGLTIDFQDNINMLNGVSTVNINYD